MVHALQTLYDRLQERKDTRVARTYRVPTLWTGHVDRTGARVVEVEPASYFGDIVGEILAGPDASPVMLASSGEWTKEAVSYNMFVRHTTAFDHDGDGTIAVEETAGGFRETGTLLKSIALLPYLKRMGVTAVHILPVTLIGSDGRKGTLGSPYAIKNPYKLDPRLAEPWLDLGVDVEFGAFVESAHRLGMRVVMEFVFRTAARDSEWIPDHPNWFYWIDADTPDRDGSAADAPGYGSPFFNDEELAIIHARVRKNDTQSLPPPSMAYRKMFSDPPDELADEGGIYLGTTWEGRSVRVPGAFADWPPDDVQPPWTDVTYLKMYDHDAFNYIAYNTIRVYDSRLATVDNENRGLWNTIINIVPHYQKSFAIDGVMIDMGHALPRRLKQSLMDRARKVNPDFAFWEENFSISPRSRAEGYNAVAGYLWSDEHLPHKLREFCAMLAGTDVPLPFFATAETHNTPRSASRPGGTVFSRLACAVNAFLPGIPLIHQGFELGETLPVNTGLGFSAEEIAALPARMLPLFSEGALCWESDGEFTGFIGRVMELRSRWLLIVTDPRHETFHLVPSSDESVLAFARTSDHREHILTVVANTNCSSACRAEIRLPEHIGDIVCALSGRTFHGNGGLYSIDFAAGEVLVFPLTEPPL